MAVDVGPKESKDTLLPVANTFAVENGLLYDYYSIKFGDRKGDFVTLLKLPPVMRDGYVTYQKKLYKVSLRDFFRSRVNVGQPAYQPATGTDSASAPVLPNAEPETVGTPVQQSGTSESDDLQINQAADVAWEEQVRALLYLDDPEEEWQYETAAQS